MAKTAMNQLGEQLEAIRKEAFDAGYAAAMQALREFAGRSPNAAAAAVVSSRGRKVAAKAGVTKAVAKTAKPQRTTASKAQSTTAKPKLATVRKSRARGSNAMLIAGVLRETSGVARPADIRKALQRSKGVAISFPSIRHALGQLAKRGEVEASADRKEWRYVRNGAA